MLREERGSHKKRKGENFASHILVVKKSNLGANIFVLKRGVR